MMIKEGVEGTWYYHLADDDSYSAYCGRLVMHTSISLISWDTTPKDYHIPERWCKKCEKLADSMSKNWRDAK